MSPFLKSSFKVESGRNEPHRREVPDLTRQPQRRVSRVQIHAHLRVCACIRGTHRRWAHLRPPKFACPPRTPLLARPRRTPPHPQATAETPAGVRRAASSRTSCVHGVARDALSSRVALSPLGATVLRPFHAALSPFSCRVVFCGTDKLRFVRTVVRRRTSGPFWLSAIINNLLRPRVDKASRGECCRSSRGTV